MVRPARKSIRKTQAHKVANADVLVSPQGKQTNPGYRKRVYDIVRRIPAGRVMTYGQIAIILGEGYTPRTVGYVMHASEDESVPWQRVINSQGACSTGRIVLPTDMQQRMLEAEGIEFNARGRCDLDRFRWVVDDEEGSRSGEAIEERPSLYARRPSRIHKTAIHNTPAKDSRRKK